MSGASGTVEGRSAARFRSSRELRQILSRVLKEIDADPDQGPRLRGIAAPLRIEITNPTLVLNLAPASDGDRHCLAWDFSRRPKREPELCLSMDGEVANSFFQGRENPAIAIARGRIHASVGEPVAALRFFPAAKSLFARYRAVVAERYPHLALD